MRTFSMRSKRWRHDGRVLLIMAATLLNPGAAMPALAAPKIHTIVIEAMQFTPKVLEVKAGDTVVWVNKDAFPHNATATNQAFKSKDIASNGAWKFKPARKGTFPYICTLHPTMTASLIVK
jgi:plastocyanin